MSKANGNHWPWLLAGLLLGGVAMNIAMVLRASNDPSFAVEEDYYQKAVNWDEYREQLRKSEALGWQFTLNPSLDETGLHLRARLADVLGRNIPDAEIEVEAVHLARANTKLSARMDHKNSEFYATLPAQRTGAYEFRIVATRGDDRFIHTTRAHLERTQP